MFLTTCRILADTIGSHIRSVIDNKSSLFACVRTQKGLWGCFATEVTIIDLSRSFLVGLFLDVVIIGKLLK